MKTKDWLPDLAKLQADLASALGAHDDAKQEESSARSRETAALNNLNAAQKALDAAMDKMRQRADMSTEWGRQRRDAGRMAS